MHGYIVRAQDGKEGILLFLFRLERRARPGLMNNATARIPAEGTRARAFAKVRVAFASRAHGERLGRQDKGFGARWQLAESRPVSVLVEAEHVLVC